MMVDETMEREIPLTVTEPAEIYPTELVVFNMKAKVKLVPEIEGMLFKVKLVMVPVVPVVNQYNNPLL